jgi:putative ABC transport system permease protein
MDANVSAGVDVQGGGGFMSDLLLDLRFALRRWGKRRTFTVTALLTLALGIGATTAIFSVVNGLLLRPLPWQSPERLVTVSVARPHWRSQSALADSWDKGWLSWRMFRGLQEKTRTIAAVGTYNTPQVILNRERNEVVQTMTVSSSFLPMLGVQPHLGRFFTAEEDDVQSDAVLITYEAWVRRFAASPDAIGARVGLANATRVIVGVVPRGFRFGATTPEFFSPFGNVRDKNDGNHFMRGVARLQPAITIEQAEADIAPVIQAGTTTEVKLPHLVSLDRELRGEFVRPLWMLMAAAVGLLLIACANVGGLLLGEASVRRHEIAVRSAVGGSRGRLMRQLMVEAIALSLLAGGLGCAVALYLTPALVAFAPPGLSGAESIASDWRVLSFAVALTMTTSLLFGLGPSLMLLGAAPGRALIEGGRDPGLRRQRAHGAVVAMQIALATVLLVGASLLSETVIRISRVPVGFDPGNVLVVSLRAATAMPEAAQLTWTSGLIARLSAVPGVVSVAATANVPFSGSYGSNTIAIEGKTFDRNRDAARQVVTNDYFSLMRVPILKGRAFDVSDVPGAYAAVVSSTFERELMDGNALGKRFTLNRRTFTVVGIVPDTKQREYTDPATPMFYVLDRQYSAWTNGNFVIRTAAAPEALVPAVRAAITAQDSSAVVTRITPMAALLAGSIAEERYRAFLSTLFGVIALLLAAIGLYGLVARNVADRLREFGVRSALGARPHDIRMLVLNQSARLVAGGLLVGIPSALVASRAIASLLYGVAPTAPHVLVLVTAVLAAVAALGALAPANRAGKVDPAVALRQ